MKPADLGKPRLRGRLHQYAFFVALVSGIVLSSIALSRLSTVPALAKGVRTPATMATRRPNPYRGMAKATDVRMDEEVPSPPVS